MPCKMSVLHERTFATEFLGELNEPEPPSGFPRSLAICDMTNDLGNPLGGAGLFNSPINSVSQHLFQIQMCVLTSKGA